MRGGNLRSHLDFRCAFFGAVAQLAESWTVDPEGAGSTPVRIASFSAATIKVNTRHLILIVAPQVSTIRWANG